MVYNIRDVDAENLHVALPLAMIEVPMVISDDGPRMTHFGLESHYLRPTGEPCWENGGGKTAEVFKDTSGDTKADDDTYNPIVRDGGKLLGLQVLIGRH